MMTRHITAVPPSPTSTLKLATSSFLMHVPLRLPARMRIGRTFAPVRLTVVVLVSFLLFLTQRVLARGRRGRRVRPTAPARAIHLRVHHHIRVVQRTATTHQRNTLSSILHNDIHNRNRVNHLRLFCRFSKRKLFLRHPHKNLIIQRTKIFEKNRGVP